MPVSAGPLQDVSGSQLKPAFNRDFAVRNRNRTRRPSTEGRPLLKAPTPRRGPSKKPFGDAARTTTATNIGAAGGRDGPGHRRDADLHPPRERMRASSTSFRRERPDFKTKVRYKRMTTKQNRTYSVTVVVEDSDDNSADNHGLAGA